MFLLIIYLSVIHILWRKVTQHELLVITSLPLKQRQGHWVFYYMFIVHPCDEANINRLPLNRDLKLHFKIYVICGLLYFSEFPLSGIVVIN